VKIACDEGVPRPLVRRLQGLGLDVSPQPPAWRGLSNGRLIAAVASAGFDVLLSNDKNLVHQHNLLNLEIGIVTLPTNKLDSLVPRSADIAATLLRVSRRQFVAIGLDGRCVRRQMGPSGTLVEDELQPLTPFGP